MQHLEDDKGTKRKEVSESNRKQGLPIFPIVDISEVKLRPLDVTKIR